MSLQIRVKVEVGESSESDAQYVRLEHRETVIAPSLHPEIADLVALTQATLDRMLSDIGARSRDQLEQITRSLA